MWIELFCSKDNRKLKYGVSLCLIFKNEAPFLQEWINYHLIIGVDHFYLYNNNSTDNYLDILEKFIDKGVVTLIDFPYEHAQMEAYKHCYQNFRSESNWISFLDADEFVCPRYKETIGDWLHDFSKYPAVNIQWLVFGSGGLLNHDYSKSVIEQYVVCWDDFYKHGKSFVNTRYDIANFGTSYLHHHTHMNMKIFGFRLVVPAVNQFGYICTMDHTWGGGKRKRDNSTIQINHYQTKAWDVYSEKMNKTDVFYEKTPKSIEIFNKINLKAISSDYQIFRFLVKTRLKCQSD